MKKDYLTTPSLKKFMNLKSVALAFFLFTSLLFSRNSYAQDADNDGILDVDEMNCPAGSIEAPDLPLAFSADPPGVPVTASYGDFDITYAQSGLKGANDYNETDTDYPLGLNLTGIEPFPGNIMTYNFTPNVSNFVFTIADLDSGELIHVNAYDGNGNRIADLTSYITADMSLPAPNTSITPHVNTVTASHGLNIDVQAPQTWQSVLNNYVELSFTDIEISKIEIELSAVGSIDNFSTPVYYIRMACESVDTDGDTVPDFLDLDSDNDGIPDSVEGNGDADGDGVPNFRDLDSDNDGIFDVVESGQIDPANNIVDNNNDGIIDAANAGTVGTNGLFDPLETAPDSNTLANDTADSDNDGIPDSNELDADNDGCFDVVEAGFEDGDSNGLLGNGTIGAGLTVDVNGVVTSGVDGYTEPDDLNGINGYDFQEVGQAVSITTQPTDQSVALNATVNFDITGTSPVYQWYESTDGGATYNPVINGGIYSGGTTATLTINANTLALNGNMYRVVLSSPGYACDGNITSNPVTLTVIDDDWDNDGIPDNIDLDDDNDGIPDSVEGNGDADGDGVPNFRDLDSDNDGIFDIVESGQIDPANNIVDNNNDGIIDAANAGTVGTNGLFDPLETAPDSNTLANDTADSDNDGIPDSNELDADNDGCFDVIEAGFEDGDSNGYLANGTFGAGLTVDVNGVVNTPGSTGYTEPDDLNGINGYDFQEVGQAVSITTQPTDQTVVLNANANFNLAGTSPVYQWYESTDGGATYNPVINGGIYSGGTTATLTINANTLALNGNMYRVVLSSPGYACDGNITSNPVTLTVIDDDWDNDGVPDNIDIDSDNDGIPDVIESGGIDPYADNDADGVPAYLDDNDNDNTVGDDNNAIEPAFDTDGDGVPNHFDLDSDNDGIFDIVESGQISVASNTVDDSDNNGIIDAANAGTVGTNGLFDPLEDGVDTGVLITPILNSDDPSDNIPDSNEINSDGDGCNDTIEAGYQDGDNNGLLGIGTFGAGLTVDVNGVVTSGGPGNGYTEPVDNDNNGIYDYREVGEAVTITTQPTDQTIILNATANFDVTGTSPNYQWQVSINGGVSYGDISNGINYSGVQTATLTITNTPASFEGNMYRVILSSPAYACDGNITSNGALLTIVEDFDQDGIPDAIDLDDDNDGIPDAIEGTGDLDGDGIPNHHDLDSDGDGVYDTNEAGFADLDADNNGIIDGPNADFGTNGLFDGVETTPDSGTTNYTLLNTDSDANPDFLDIDDDNDGINTEFENPGFDGNGDPADAQDTDNDGTPDYLDVDDDGDGVNTEFEVSNADGDGNPNTGVAIPNTDNDLLPNYLDTDDDGDGVDTIFENPNPDNDGNPNTGDTQDTDNNGTPDYLDTDDDGDSILTIFENPNPDGDGNPNTGDTQDSDGDLIFDYLDVDDDNDGVYTIFENPDPNGDGNPSDAQNTDNDGFPDYLDIDDDNDGINTEDENPDPNGDGNPSDAQDFDNDGTPDYLDIDDDNDGITNLDEDLDGDGDPRNDDSDGDGNPNYLDIDDDGDGIKTITEGPGNSDDDAFPNYLDQDSDNDGIPDNVEGQSTADYKNPTGEDADGNGLDDAYEVVPGSAEGISPVNSDTDADPDYLDTDSDNDTVPDSTEGHDYNADGQPDILPSGTDSDNDGLDDAYDGSIGDFLDPNGLKVEDSPANDLPNTDVLLDTLNNFNPPRGDAEVDYRDEDDDNDSILTIDEDGNGDGDPTNDDCDEDGFPDYLDPTSCTIIPDGFSPNGDGDNETFIIPALRQYKNFEMEVYDRWGNIVYDYKRNGKELVEWWDGHSSGTRTISKDKKVPVGTYYYIIRYNEGGIEPIAGWVYINY